MFSMSASWLVQNGARTSMVNSGYVQGEIDLLGPGNPSLEHCGLTDHVPDDPE